MIFNLEELQGMRKPQLVDVAKKLGIDVAVRWGKTELIQKIRECQKLNELNELESEAEIARKPDFENLTVEPETTIPDRRGGYREGAGRPNGMTNLESKIRKLLDLETPDIVVLKIVGIIAIWYGIRTGNSFQQFEIESMALAITRELYYFFPNIQGNSSRLAFHVQCISDTATPFTSRMMENLIRKNESNNNQTENINTEETNEQRSGN